MPASAGHSLMKPFQTVRPESPASRMMPVCLSHPIPTTVHPCWIRTADARRAELDAGSLSSHCAYRIRRDSINTTRGRKKNFVKSLEISAFYPSIS